jgi:pSer/pThr/pTyr-binding forkhead associated (FHA) protein
VRLTFEIEKLPDSSATGFANPCRKVTLDQDVVKIGTLASSHLLLDDAAVSRMHAVIEVTDYKSGWKSVTIIDLGSASGTIVNGKAVNTCTLKSGDILTLGRTRIIVRFE